MESKASLPDLAELVSRPDDERRCTRFSTEDVTSMSSTCPDVVLESEHNNVDGWNTIDLDVQSPVVKLVDKVVTETRYVLRKSRYGPLEQGRLASIMETMRARGEYRKLAVVDPHWRKRLDDLELRFPMFGEVVEYLRVMHCLAEHGTGAIRLDPILLNGPPGCGKSLFSECVGRYVGAGYVPIRMETAQSNSQLVGSSDYWSNSKPGEIFNVMIESDCANPVVFLDEIEKTPQGQHDPLLGLLSLLEPGTARRFVDQSVPFVTLDASHIIFVCASNDADILPDYISSRLRRFDIDMPMLEQGRKLVRCIHRDLANEMSDAAMSVRLPAKTIDRLAALSPRVIKRTLRESIGRALYKGRDRVLPGDLRIEVETVPSTKGIGFL